MGDLFRDPLNLNSTVGTKKFLRKSTTASKSQHNNKQEDQTGNLSSGLQVNIDLFICFFSILNPLLWWAWLCNWDNNSRTAGYRDLKKKKEKIHQWLLSLVLNMNWILNVTSFIPRLWYDERHLRDRLLQERREGPAACQVDGAWVSEGWRLHRSLWLLVSDTTFTCYLYSSCCEECIELCVIVGVGSYLKCMKMNMEWSWI